MFISFEGIEGCGKTTQVDRLAAAIEAQGISVVMTREPGGTSVGQKIRDILLDARNQSLSPLAELFLYAADRSQHIQEVIRPALKQGKWVICDRFFDATTVYQGCSRGLDMNFVALLNESATGGIKPDVTFLLDCPVNVGLQRAFDRNKRQQLEGQDRFEKEDKMFHRAVREGYLALAEKETERFVVVDASRSPDEVASLIFRHMQPFMGGR